MSVLVSNLVSSTSRSSSRWTSRSRPSAWDAEIWARTSSSCAVTVSTVRLRPRAGLLFSSASRYARTVCDWVRPAAIAALWLSFISRGFFGVVVFLVAVAVFDVLAAAAFLGAVAALVGLVGVSVAVSAMRAFCHLFCCFASGRVDERAAHCCERPFRSFVVVAAGGFRVRGVCSRCTPGHSTTASRTRHVRASPCNGCTVVRVGLCMSEPRLGFCVRVRRGRCMRLPRARFGLRCVGLRLLRVRMRSTTLGRSCAGRCGRCSLHRP